MFRSLINIRFSGGGGLTERGGQHRVNTDALEACITGIIPGDAIPIDTDEMIYFAGENPDPAAGTSILSQYDPIGGYVSPSPDDVTASNLTALFYARGPLTNGAGGVLGRGAVYHDPGSAGTPYVTKGDDFNPIGLPLYANASNGNPYVNVAFSTVAIFHGTYYAVISGEIGSPSLSETGVRKVGPSAAFTVADIVRNFSTGSSGPSYRVWMRVYDDADELVVPLDDGGLHVLNADGVWRRVPMPTGCTVHRQRPDTVAEYGGLLYFTGFGPGGGYLIYAYNGTDIVPAHSIAGAPPTYVPLAAYRSSLLYGNNVAGTVKLGTYDGTTWDDSAHTFTGADEVRQLLVGFETLYALRGDTVEESTAPSAAWAVLETDPGAFDIGAVYVTLAD